MSNRLRRQRFARCVAPTVLVVLFHTSVLWQRSVSADELPRYRFTPGQVLVYRSADRPVEADVGNSDKLVSRHDYEWTFYVVRQNNDDSWRIAFLQKWTSSVCNPEQGDRTFSEPTTLFKDGYFDLAPDGQVLENWTIHSFANPLLVFPPLPPNVESLKTGWESNLAVEDTRRKLRLAESDPPDANAWRFVEEDEKFEDAAYLTKRQREFDFDSTRGLVRSFVTHTEEGWSGFIRPAVPITLVSDQELEPAELQKLAHDCDLYYAARQEADLLLARAGADLAHTAQLLEKARARLELLTNKMQTAQFQKIFAQRLAAFQSDNERYRRRARIYGAILGKSSEDWTTTDLDGNLHQLKDYRGKVVVLDFWFRGCAWCIRGMPEMKQLSIEFEGQPLALFGVNLDEKEGNARFVVDALKLNYPTLRNGEIGEGIDKKYLVTGGPTVIVLDGRGIVRHVHVGFSPTLRGELEDEIRNLFEELDP
jgi:thiol-disulfide isomerase/thioredoxin